MAILGLMTTSNLEANRANNARRKVFYDYPTGKFPLMGLLSLMDDEEELTDPELGWFEESWRSARSVTKVGTTGTKGPVVTSLTNLAQPADATVAVGVTFYMRFASVDDFRVRDVLRIANVTLASGTVVDVTCYVTALDQTNLTAALQPIDSSLAVSGISNQVTTNNDLYVSVIGTATGEGDRSQSNGRSTDPFKVTNYTQIFRTVCGPWTGTALKMGQVWDGRPRYVKDVKDATLRHMTEMEKAVLFGVKRAQTTTNADGDTVPLRFAGGVTHYLKQWDIGNTVNGGEFNYRPGGADLTNASFLATAGEEKRFIKGIGQITKSQWNELVRRMFSDCSDKGNEKLVVCGDKTLAILNAYCDNNSIRMESLDTKTESYGMNVKRLNTPHGDLLFKTHPLFKEDPMLQSTMAVLDMGDISYHCMEGRDTELLKNRQNRDADYRKDEWLTECTFEIRKPRRHMWLEGLTAIL